MAEPLKNSFGPDVAEGLAARFATAWADFDTDAFLAEALDSYEPLELKQRAQQISDALANQLPADRGQALETVIDVLDRAMGEPRRRGMEAFFYMPLGHFITDHGLDHFEASMAAQHRLTRLFSAEFSIRAFLERRQDETLRRLAEWADDPNEHVRRLVSEGTRPRLPWAPRLKEFERDPSPVLELLEQLKDDPSEYVRRSVANNLNDIAKDHPDRVLAVAAKWWREGGIERRALVEHALRTLIKQGHPEALAVLGFGPDSPVVVSSVSCSPSPARIGDKTRVEVEVTNPSSRPGRALVDLRVHFVKADGSRRPKVFKGTQLELGAHDTASFRRTVSLRQHTTRIHYPGDHVVEVMVNGIGQRSIDLAVLPAE